MGVLKHPEHTPLGTSLLIKGGERASIQTMSIFSKPDGYMLLLAPHQRCIYAHAYARGIPAWPIGTVCVFGRNHEYSAADLINIAPRGCLSGLEVMCLMNVRGLDR